MIHYEEMVKLLTSSRISRGFAHDLPVSMAEDFNAFLESKNVQIRAKRWMNVVAAHIAPARWEALTATKKYHESYIAYMIQNFFVLTRYVRAGERVFSAEKNLVQLLLDTDVPDINGEQFKLPFPALFLEFPAERFTLEFRPLADGQSARHAHPIGCYIIDMRPVDPQVVIEVVIDPRVENVGELGFCMRLLLPVKPGEPVQWTSLKEEFRRNMDDILRTPESYRVLDAQSLVADEMLRFTVNGLLYCTSADADITTEVARWHQLQEQIQSAVTHRRRKRLETELQELPRTQRNALGRMIKINYGAPRAADTSTEADEHRKILKRFQVRGHWRNQPYGPMSESPRLTRLKFIEPYWKGPADMAEMLRRKYQLG